MPESYIPPSFQHHLDAEAPEFIYHYTSANGLLGIVQGNELWATKIQFMNDSSEFRVAFEMIEHRLRRDEVGDAKFEIADRDPTSTALTKRERWAYGLWKEMERIANINICVVCFCRSGDILSQWRGYSGGSGFSMGFSGGKLTEIAKNFFCGACIYDSDLQRKIIDELCKHYLRDDFITDDEGDARQIREQFSASLTRCAGFFKNRAFEAEDEWRLVSPPLHTNLLEFRPGKSLIVPYYRIQLPPSSSDSPIDHVIVGPCPHVGLAKSAVETLLYAAKIGERNTWVPGVIPKVSVSSIPYRDW